MQAPLTPNTKPSPAGAVLSLVVETLPFWRFRQFGGRLYMGPIDMNKRGL